MNVDQSILKEHLVSSSFWKCDNNDDNSKCGGIIVTKHRNLELCSMRFSSGVMNSHNLINVILKCSM